MKHIFGFYEDYDKIVYGFKNSLTLVSWKTDADVIFRGAAADAGKVSLDKLSWFLPHVMSVKTAPEKPRFIIFAFQQAKDGYQTKNPSTIDHVNLKNAYVTLISDRYPTVHYNLSFSNEKFSRMYGDAALFGVKIFGMDELITQSDITPSDYKTLTLFSRSMSASRKKNSNPLLLISK